MALEAIYNYKMDAGQELSAVSLSWGLDERRTDPNEMKLTDKWMGALLIRVCRPCWKAWWRVAFQEVWTCMGD